MAAKTIATARRGHRAVFSSEVNAGGERVRIPSPHHQASAATAKEDDSKSDTSKHEDKGSGGAVAIVNDTATKGQGA